MGFKRISGFILIELVISILLAAVVVSALVILVTETDILSPAGGRIAETHFAAGRVREEIRFMANAPGSKLLKAEEYGTFSGTATSFVDTFRTYPADLRFDVATFEITGSGSDYSAGSYGSGVYALAVVDPLTKIPVDPTVSKGGILAVAQLKNGEDPSKAVYEKRIFPEIRITSFWYEADTGSRTLKIAFTYTSPELLEPGFENEAPSLSGSGYVVSPGRFGF